MTLRAKKQIRNPSHHFTNTESAHRCLPPNDVRHLSASIGTETKTRKNTDDFKTSPGACAKDLHAVVTADDPTSRSMWRELVPRPSRPSTRRPRWASSFSS